MGKVFTITEGLENMGALKTGGQGSVYKGRRIGEIITAVKLLPTPIHTESEDDKNYIDFQNEVNKLKRVNENPNPHVVKILSSGITESGSFPFIEMEFIEGPDLEELLKPPHDPIFSIKEVIKIAEQLSQALEHCHKVDVRHGDIKSNNVKFSTDTGNYVLLDFGLAIMSDEQRRTSLRHAGAIEFMAPEQNQGQMLSETDIYSFGVVLFELIAGVVPFPLHDKGETARNRVMVSHMETPPPDLLELRRQNMPQSWSEEKRQREMNIPMWLVSMIYRCLEKKPENRFANGMELHEYIALNSTLYNDKVELTGTDLTILQKENEKLLREKSQLQTKLAQYQQATERRDDELETLRQAVSQKELEINELRNAAPATIYETTEPQRSGVSKAAFYALLVLTLCLAAFAAYSLLSKNGSTGSNMVGGVDTAMNASDSGSVENTGEKKIDEQGSPVVNEIPVKTPQQKADSIKQALQQKKRNDQANNAQGSQENNIDTTAGTGGGTSDGDDNGNNTANDDDTKQYYTVISRAYFHDKPDADTKREGVYITHWNNAKLTAIDETSDFIYVVFKNHLGQTSKGWLKKSDLKLVGG